MYSLTVNDSEFYDSVNNEFITVKGGTLQLEHSLLSISKWEAKYKRAFLSEKEGPSTTEECIDYIRCMTLNKNVDPAIYNGITQSQIEEVLSYVGNPMTATTFSNRRRKRGGRVISKITNEVIYWQMLQNGIPFECEKWHLNRLLTLIRVCDEKGEPPKKMSQDALLRQYASTNAARRKAKRH